MATDLTDITIDGVSSATGLSGGRLVSATLDTSVYNVDTSATGALELISVPADTFVAWVQLNVLTAEGSSVALIIGDGDDPNGWMEAGALNTTGLQINAGAFPTANGKVYTTADTIDGTAAGDLDACIFTVSALMFQL